MLRRIWETTKAALAIGALVGAALISADRLDRRPTFEARHVAGAVEPVTTGSITRRPGSVR